MAKPLRSKPLPFTINIMTSQNVRAKASHVFLVKKFWESYCNFMHSAV